MLIQILTVPDCPHGPELERRLAEALGDRSGVRVERRVLDTAREAEQWGMHGSPTVLIDDLDPFADADTPTSLSCRLYREADGRTGGSPSVADLRRALDEADLAEH